MNIDIRPLKNQSLAKIDIDIIHSFTKDELKNTNIIELNDVSIKGNMISDNLDEYILSVVVAGTMVLPDSLTLDPVNHYFQIEIDGNIDDLLEEIGETSKKTEFAIDIFPIIWENILMEIPIRIVNENNKNIKLEGDGWKLINEFDTTSTNPELEKLKDLLK